MHWWAFRANGRWRSYFHLGFQVKSHPFGPSGIIAPRHLVLSSSVARRRDLIRLALPEHQRHTSWGTAPGRGAPVAHSHPEKNRRKRGRHKIHGQTISVDLANRVTGCHWVWDKILSTCFPKMLIWGEQVLEQVSFRVRANSYISLIIPVSRQTTFVASSHPEKYFSICTWQRTTPLWLCVAETRVFGFSNRAGFWHNNRWTDMTH